MNNNKILSICIPTYNRADCLKQCLESITSQFILPELIHKVEVVISDNASTDATEIVAKEFVSKFSNFSYSKNPENLGFDRNALLLVEKAKGEFVWFLGDDDALFPGSISYLLNQIGQQRFNYCVVNFWGYDIKLEKPALKYSNQNIKTDAYFSKLADFIKSFNDDENLVGFFCGLSVQVFKRDLWFSMADKNKYIGTNAIHLYILLTVMKDQSFAVFAKPLVKARSDNIRWETFKGLESAKSRVSATFKILIWIFDLYKIPYSKLEMNLKFYTTLSKNFVASFIRNKIFKSQKVRDKIKKMLGKL